jgi:flagellar protein FlaJ
VILKMFENLKRNLKQEKAIAKDMKAIAIGYREDLTNKDLYLSSLNALAKQLDLLNNVVPELLKESSPFFDKASGELKGKGVKLEAKKKVGAVDAKKPAESLVPGPGNVVKKVAQNLKPAESKPIKESVVSASYDLPSSKKVAQNLKPAESKPIKESVVSASYDLPSSKKKVAQNLKPAESKPIKESVVSASYDLPSSKKKVAQNLKPAESLIPSPRQLASKKKVPQRVKPVKPRPARSNVVSVSYVSPSTKEKKFVTINKKDRAEFLKKLKLSEDALKGVRDMKKERVGGGIRKPNPYISFSSKYFRKYSDKVSNQFADLSKDLKKANVPILLSSYLSMAMMSSVIAGAFGVLIFGLLLAFSLSNWFYFVLPLGFMGLTLAGFYLYPSSEASNVYKNISYELPFSTIHMAAIAGSNITPVKIFKIIAASKEYPNIGAEMKKVVVQIDVYGYDMVTSLKNVAKTTSNGKLSELFSGLATNISSGGALKNYLEKKSQSFLTDYRLERQKYSALAGTFMDVYISLLIAAPLVLMMMFIVMNVAGLGMGGLSIMSLMGLAIGVIIIVNIIFIVVLNMKQPRV